MKKLFIIITLFFSGTVAGQNGTWTWISGPNTTLSAPVYGVQGVPSVSNHPGGAYEYNGWKDKQGNFWVYGGTYPHRSDLWKFDPVTLEWTWVKGSMLVNEPPVYGIQGLADPANTPGQRSYCSATWVDTTGNLWLFGGSNNNQIGADLWKYEIQTNCWTWMSGTSLPAANGVHGTQGVPSLLNFPGGRAEAGSCWTDSTNNLWLWGGYGLPDTGSTLGRLNDMMKYDIATNEWTWMAGSTGLNVLPNWGTLGIPDPTNDPGGRYTYSPWQDQQGNFWMFGGELATSFATCGDVWKYDFSTSLWTWVAGSTQFNDTGIYQNTCQQNQVNRPAARLEHKASVVDQCGNFWMYGGYRNGDVLNDLWTFNPVLETWMWLNGTNQINQPGNYGILGVPAITNIPPGRCGALAFWGNDNRYYLFGGSGSSIVNNTYADTWVYTPDSGCIIACAIPPDALFIQPGPICPGTCVDFTNLSSNATSFEWLFPGANPDSSVVMNPSNICYNAPGNYDVTLIAGNAAGMDTLTLSGCITVYPHPPPQSISQNGDTLFALAGATSYQWYYNGNAIGGATDYYYIAGTSGDYNVVATDANGCEVEAAIFNVIAGLTPVIGNSNIIIYPNPAHEVIVIGLDPDAYRDGVTGMSISIYDVLGEIVSSVEPQTGLNQFQNTQTSLDVSTLNPGIYILEMISESKLYRTRFVKD